MKSKIKIYPKTKSKKPSAYKKRVTKVKHFMTKIAIGLTPKQKICKFNQGGLFCTHKANTDFRGRGYINKERSRSGKRLMMKRCMEQFCPFYYDVFIKEEQKPETEKTDEDVLIEELKNNDNYKQWEEEWEKNKNKIKIPHDPRYPKYQKIYHQRYLRHLQNLRYYKKNKKQSK